MFGATKIKVEGLHCHHCEAKVNEAVSAIPGVKAAKASAAKGILEVKGTIDDETMVKIKEAVASVGFKVIE